MPEQKKVRKGYYKKLVKEHGEFVLDYSEFSLKNGYPCWFVGRGRVAGDTAPIPSGLHKTPAEAWKAAAIALRLAKE